MRPASTPPGAASVLPELWVVDASPFIGLAKIGRLDPLTAPGRDVVLPEAVIREVEAGPDDPARQALSEGWGRRLPSAPVPPELASWRLGAGEEAVLALALAPPGALAIVDDTDGRRAKEDRLRPWRHCCRPCGLRACSCRLTRSCSGPFSHTARDGRLCNFYRSHTPNRRLRLFSQYPGFC